MKLKEIKNGNMNKIYLLDRGTDKYIIRTSDFNNEFECKILRLLKEYQFSCPQIITNFQLKDKYIMLYDYIEGQNPNIFDEKFFINLANLLKQLHSIDAQFNKEEYLLNEESQSKLKEYFLKAKQSKYLKEEESFVKKQYEEASILDLDTFDKCIIHSDIKKENMIQNKDDLYLIDFGNCYIGTRIIDIIRVIMWFFIKDKNYDLEKIKLFLKTYFHNNPITNKEKNNVDELFIYCILYNLLKDISLCEDHVLTANYIEKNSLNWLSALKEKEKVLKIGEMIKNA